jgi:hypothetical protein
MIWSLWRVWTTWRRDLTSEPDPAFFEVPAEYKVVDRGETAGKD